MGMDGSLGGVRYILYSTEMTNLVCRSTMGQRVAKGKVLEATPLEETVGSCSVYT